MSTIIVAILVIIALGFALRGVLKHWRGEGACCGGGGVSAVPPKKELEGRIIGEKVIGIEGMTCGNCKIRVEQALDSIEGAVSEVNLHHNRATLKMTREATDDEIRSALVGSDYKITSISAKSL